jgi:hypothetical protein
VPVTGDTECMSQGPKHGPRHDIRLKIRTALSDVPNDHKLVELLAALEEEMFEFWGEREPRTITISPCKSALTFIGLRSPDVAA